MHFFKYFFLKQRNIERPFERRSKIDRRSGRSNDVRTTISNVRPNLGQSGHQVGANAYLYCRQRSTPPQESRKCRPRQTRNIPRNASPSTELATMSGPFPPVLTGGSTLFEILPQRPLTTAEAAGIIVYQNRGFYRPISWPVADS